MGSTYILRDEAEVENQAELYLKRSVNLQTRDGIKLINRTSLAEGSTVLDLGCGTGNLTSVLADKVGANGHVTGIDPDRERIKVAKENNARRNISFVESDGATFPENQYDLVFSNYVLHWIEDKEAVFKRVSKFLRPGGKFAFTLCQALPPLFAEVLETMDEDKAEIFLQTAFFVSQHKLEKLAAENGLQVSYKESGVSRLPFPDFDTALQFVYASSSGYIDVASVNKTSLEGLERKYIEKTVEFSEEYASFILVKE